MSTAQPKADPPRPQEVTIGGLLAISGSIVAIVSLLISMSNLYSVEMTDVLRDIADGPGLNAWSLSIEDMRTFAKVAIMVMAVLSVTSAVLGVYVLRRDRVARIVLTVLGAGVAFFALFSGVAGVVLSIYIAMSIGMLWSKPARTWFRPESALEGGPPSGPPGPPPRGHDPNRPPPQGPPPGWQPPPGWPPPPPGWRPPPGWQPPVPPPGWRPPPPPPGWRPPPNTYPPAAQPPPTEQPPSSGQGEDNDRRVERADRARPR